MLLVGRQEGHPDKGPLNGCVCVCVCVSLHSVSYKNVKSCADFPDSDRSDRLRSELHHYLECQPPESTVTNGTLSFARESEALNASQLTELVPTDVCFAVRLLAQLLNFTFLCFSLLSTCIFKLP